MSVRTHVNCGELLSDLVNCQHHFETVRKKIANSEIQPLCALGYLLCNTYTKISRDKAEII